MKRDSYSTRVSWHEHMSDTDMILMIHKRLELQSYDLSENGYARYCRYCKPLKLTQCT